MAAMIWGKSRKEAQDDREFYIRFFESIIKRDPWFEEVLENLGMLYTQVGEYDKGLRVDRKLVRLRPEDPNAHYNLACSLALKRRFADAMRSLQRAVELGYLDWEHMDEDEDLAELRDYPAYQKWYQEVTGETQQEEE